MTEITQTFSKSGPGANLLKRFTVRHQSKINKIRRSQDLVQSKSNPMLISDTNVDMKPLRFIYNVLSVRKKIHLQNICKENSKLQNKPLMHPA